MFTVVMDSELYVAVHHLMDWRTDTAAAREAWTHGGPSSQLHEKAQAARGRAIQALQPWCSSTLLKLRGIEQLADQAAVIRLQLAMAVARTTQAESNGQWPDDSAVERLIGVDRLPVAQKLRVSR
jgi:hypothetical protein